MLFLVQLTDDAARDLEDICDYIDRHEAPGRADHVLKQNRKVVQQPFRAPPPRKLPQGIA